MTAAAPLSLWKEAGWGWALWSLEGSFGVMDSERADAAYEDYKGRELDRKMLELLGSNWGSTGNHLSRGTAAGSPNLGYHRERSD